MKKSILLLIVSLFFIVSCGSVEEGDSPAFTGTPTVIDTTPEYVGTWWLWTLNGTNYEDFQITYTITLSSISLLWPGYCAETGPLTVNGNRFIWEIASTDCPPSYVGYVRLGTLSVTNDWLTISDDDGSVEILSRLSNKPEE